MQLNPNRATGPAAFAGSRLVGALALCAILLAPAWGEPCAAQAIDFLDREDGETTLAVTPFFFLPVTTTGTSAVAGVRADLDLSGSDILDALNLAGAVRAEVAHGDFSVIVDAYFVSLGGGTTAALPGPLGGTARADISFEQGWVAVLGTYRAVQGSFETPGGGGYALDAGLGVRFNSLHQEVDARVDLGIGPGIQRTVGGTETWVEPTLMLRGGVMLDEQWGLGARTEIGGFGAGGNDLQWNVLIGGVYRPWEGAALRAGWQFYGIDLATVRGGRAFAYDVFQTGPYLGATFRF